MALEIVSESTIEKCLVEEPVTTLRIIICTEGVIRRAFAFQWHALFLLRQVQLISY